MKKIYFIGVFYAISISVFSQLNFYQQDVPITDAINSINCVDSLNCWATAASGYILKTTNGGIKWDTTQTKYASNFESVYFIDKNTGFAAGNNGVIMKSVDGGNTWTSQITSPATSSKINKITCNSSTCFFGTDGGYVYSNDKVSDTWNQIGRHASNNIYSMKMLNNDFGIVVGQSGANFGYTKDGGNNWTAKNTSFSDVWVADCIDSNVVIIGATYMGSPSYNNFATSKDGGLSWKYTKAGSANSLTAKGLKIIDYNNIYALTKNGEVFFSSDTGYTWTSQNTPLGNSFYAFYLTNSKIMYMGGTNGRIYCSHNFPYTNTRTVSENKTDAFLISPNPITEKSNYIINVSSDCSAKLKVIDITGKEILNSNIELSKGINKTKLNPSNFHQGLYIAIIEIENNIYIEKFISK